MFDSTRMGLGSPKGAEPSRLVEPLVEPLLKKPTTAENLGVCLRTVDNPAALTRIGGLHDQHQR